MFPQISLILHHTEWFQYKNMALVSFRDVKYWTVIPGNQAPLMSLIIKNKIIVILIACPTHHKRNLVLDHTLILIARETYFLVVAMSLEVGGDEDGRRICIIIKCSHSFHLLFEND